MVLEPILEFSLSLVHLRQRQLGGALNLDLEVEKIDPVDKEGQEGRLRNQVED